MKREIITGLLMAAITIAIYVLTIAIASAEEQYLVCSPAQFAATQVQVEVTTSDKTTVIVVPYGELDSDGDVRLVNLAEYAPGAYTFRYRLADESGWFSEDWSDQLRAIKPGKPGSKMRIK
jgi:hypothetical protein